MNLSMILQSTYSKEKTWKAKFIEPKPKQTLNREMLIEAGVPITTIDSCYTQRKIEPYVTVTNKK